jgi:hypothetical protein
MFWRFRPAKVLSGRRYGRGFRTAGTAGPTPVELKHRRGPSQR